jgi:hypothetical protein
MPDKSIAAVLNRSGKQTGRGNSWTRMRVCSVRSQKGIAPYQEGERKARGEVTLNASQSRNRLISPASGSSNTGASNFNVAQLVGDTPESDLGFRFNLHNSSNVIHYFDTFSDAP